MLHELCQTSNAKEVRAPAGQLIEVVLRRGGHVGALLAVALSQVKVWRQDLCGSNMRRMMLKRTAMLQQLCSRALPGTEVPRVHCLDVAPLQRPHDPQRPHDRQVRTPHEKERGGGGENR